jgi:RND family efflux transporter MFP subunit
MHLRLLVLILSGLVPGILQAQAYRPPPASVQTSPVIEKELAPVMWVPGTVVSRNDARVAAETLGRIVWMVEVGTQLKTGDVIARIDNKTWKLRLQENEANIKRLEASLTYNEKQLQRLGKLAQTNSASRTELDQMTSSMEMVTQELAQAQLSRETTQYRLQHTEIKAPFNGQVVVRYHQLGEFIQVGQAVARLVDIDNKEIRLKAPMSVARYIGAGDDVTVKGDEIERVFSVRTLIPVGDEVSRALELRVPVATDSWLVGAAVQVALPTDSARTVVAVERDALVLRADGIFVYRVTAESHAERINVVTGIGSGSLIEIQGEISVGDSVIVRGAERVRPDAAVQVIN